MNNDIRIQYFIDGSFGSYHALLFLPVLGFENQTVGAHAQSKTALQVLKFVCKRDRQGYCSSSINRWLKQAYARFESPRVHSMNEMAIPLHNVCAILERHYSCCRIVARRTRIPDLKSR